MSFSNQEMTDHDLATWTDDLLTRIELRVLMEHEVINHQRDDLVFQGRSIFFKQPGSVVHLRLP